LSVRGGIQLSADVSRRDLFEEIERPALRPLPSERFPLETVQWATIGFNYHVELREDRHYYSVPYQLRRPKENRRAKLVYDERMVSVYFDNVRLAQYRRDRSPNGYTTLPEHMPPEHRWYAEWSGPRFLSWAHSLGPEVEEVIGKVLGSRVYAPQAYRVCLGILNLQKSYGTDRLQRACRRALSFGSYSYKRIQNILAQGLEQEAHPRLDFEAPALPAHENVRGSGYYH